MFSAVDKVQKIFARTALPSVLRFAPRAEIHLPIAQMSDPEPVIRQKLKTMVTDPARVRRTDPGDPDKCPVGDLHKIFSDGTTLEKVYAGCRSAGIGCIECKGWAADNLMKVIAPIQERRAKFQSNPKQVWEIIEAGSAKARVAAEQTMDIVRDAMGMSKRFELPKSESTAK